MNVQIRAKSQPGRRHAPDLHGLHRHDMGDKGGYFPTKQLRTQHTAHYHTIPSKYVNTSIPNICIILEELQPD